MNYEKQMMAWALDRAIETMKLMKPNDASPEMAKTIAEDYCEWIAKMAPETLPDSEAKDEQS